MKIIHGKNNKKENVGYNLSSLEAWEQNMQLSSQAIFSEACKPLKKKNK